MDEKSQGIHPNKFIVERRDGSSKEGGKHAMCEFFVLDLEHDKFSRPALLAYADACESEYPQLAKELREKIK